MAVVVTGASRGIGASCVRTLSAGLALPVALVGRNLDALEAVRAQLNAAQKQQSSCWVCDLRDPVSVETTSQRIQAHYGRDIKVLVNAAGVTSDALLAASSETSMRETIEVNLISCMLLTRSMVKPMMRRKQGCIINIGSIVGSRGNAGQSVYSASKAGLEGFTKSLAKELGPLNIRVNMISPGFIETDMTKDIRDAKREAIRQATALGRFGKPEEVAQAAQFLAEAAFVTGQIIAVDGGLSF